jgi:hypothetical protein
MVGITVAHAVQSEPQSGLLTRTTGSFASPLRQAMQVLNRSEPAASSAPCMHGIRARGLANLQIAADLAWATHPIEGGPWASHDRGLQPTDRRAGALSGDPTAMDPPSADQP